MLISFASRTHYQRWTLANKLISIHAFLIQRFVFRVRYACDAAAKRNFSVNHSQVTFAFAWSSPSDIGPIQLTTYSLHAIPKSLKLTKCLKLNVSIFRWKTKRIVSINPNHHIYGKCILLLCVTTTAWLIRKFAIRWEIVIHWHR